MDDNTSIYHNYPVLTSVLLLFIYIIPIGIPALTLTTSESNLGVYALVVFLISSLVWLLVVPFAMKLPEKSQSFRDYLYTIGITRYKSKSQVILLGVLSVAIILLSSFIAATLYGDWVPSLSGLMPPTGWSPILAINAGLWEEIVFRGVILTLLLKKYSPSKAIILDAFLFGFAHGFNIIMGQLIVETMIQIISAFVASLMFAYLFIKTESLVPSILTHYAIDATVEFYYYQLFQPSVDPILSAIIIYSELIIASLVIIAVVFTISKYVERNTYMSNIP